MAGISGMLMGVASKIPGVGSALGVLQQSIGASTQAINNYTNYLRRATSQVYQLNKANKDLYKTTVQLTKAENTSKNFKTTWERYATDFFSLLIKLTTKIKSALTDFNYIANTTNELRKATTSQSLVQAGFSTTEAGGMADALKDLAAKTLLGRYGGNATPYANMSELYASEEFAEMYNKFVQAVTKGGAIEGTYFTTEYSEGKAFKEGRLVPGMDYTPQAQMTLRYEDLVNQVLTYEKGGADKLSDLVKTQRNNQRILEHMEGSLYSFDEVITADAFSNADSIDDVNISMNKGLTEAAKQRQEEIDATNREATLLESKLGNLILDAENNGLTLYQLLEKTDFGGVKGLLENIGQYINDFKGEYIKNTPKQGVVVTDPRTGVRFTATKEFADNEFEKLYKNFQYYQKTGQLSSTTSSTPNTSFNGNMSSVTDVLYNNFGSTMSQIDTANTMAATLLNPGSVNVTINNRGLNFASDKEWEDSAYKLGTFLKNLDNKTGVFGYGRD